MKKRILILFLACLPYFFCCNTAHAYGTDIEDGDGIGLPSQITTGVQCDLIEITSLPVSPLQPLLRKGAELFRKLKGIAFILSALGLVTFAINALFGKIQWSFFISINLSLIFVAVLGSLIDFLLADDFNVFPPIQDTGGEFYSFEDGLDDTLK